MKKVALGILFFAPSFVFAAEALNNVYGIIQSIGKIINTIIPIVFGLILLFFFWGLAKYVFNAGDEDARKAGRGMMIWGIVALFVAASVWGLTGFIGKAVGIENVDSVGVPTINNFGSSPVF